MLTNRNRRIDRSQRGAHELSAVRARFVCLQHGSARARLRGKERRFPARPGANVEPALPRRHRAISGERERGQLRALVLYAQALFFQGADRAARVRHRER